MKQKSKRKLSNKSKQKSEQKKKQKQKLISLIIFAFGVLISIESFEEYQELKSQNESEPVTATVHDKMAGQDLLYGKMNYIVILKENLAGKLERNLDVGQIAYVEKEEFDELEIGDTVSGFMIGGTFYNQEGLESEYTTFYIGLTIAILLFLGLITQWLSTLKMVRDFFHRLLQKRLFNSLLGALVYGLFYGIIMIGSSISFYYMGLLAMNAYETVSDEGRIETTAFVTDYYADRNYGRYKEDKYFLALSFENTVNETVYVTKEVTSHTYHAYKDRPVLISYSEENPYKIYLPTSWLDVLDIMFMNVMILYYIVCLGTVAMIYVFICKIRRKKTGSTSPEKRDGPPLSKSK